MPRGLVVRQVFLPSGLLRDEGQRWTFTSSTFTALSAPSMKHSRCEQMTLPVPLQLSPRETSNSSGLGENSCAQHLFFLMESHTVLRAVFEPSRVRLMTVIFWLKRLFNDDDDGATAIDYNSYSADYTSLSTA